MSKKKLLFENVSGNSFRLLTESMDKSKSELVREGVKKVFLSSTEDISYKRLQGVGIGYIKEISEAIKCAIQEARAVASDFGYKDDIYNSKFIKEDIGHPETDMNNQSEKREVQIAKGILQSLKLIQSSLPKNETHPNVTSELQSIGTYAQELLNTHGQ